MCSTCDLECPGTRNNTFVFNGVLDCSETVTDGILNLSNSVGIGSFDNKSDGFRRLDIFNVGVLFFTKSLFVNETCPSEDVRT
jgi:hypothetical protein